jgi:hypothetical protein
MAICGAGTVKHICTFIRKRAEKKKYKNEQRYVYTQRTEICIYTTNRDIYIHNEQRYIYIYRHTQQLMRACRGVELLL